MESEQTQSINTPPPPTTTTATNIQEKENLHMEHTQLENNNSHTERFLQLGTKTIATALMQHHRGIF
ncbi:hypothetical protein CHS0354_020867 [Potamilus streckersoni]|uniref:Uncharacterized protein n=1 Tax=Potamilus streckersoni TaxID=2493646 RepID=A0AAE0SFC2_9BIVA|nr:hypothetical protein CHS0354_020867 [Potamilus streckersoni]